MSALGDYLLSLPDDKLDILLKNGRRAFAADSINKEANEHLTRAYEDYKRIRKKTVDAIDDLNKRKIKVFGCEIARFVDLFSEIQNIDVSECKGLSEIKHIEFSELDYKDMNNEIADLYDFITTGMKTYFFGGIVLGEIIMGRKSKISYNNAKTNEAAACIEIEHLESEKMELEAIEKLAKQQNKVIRKLAKLAKQPLCIFADIVLREKNWIKFTTEEKQTVASLMSLIKLLKMIIDQPIIKTDGTIDNGAYSLLAKDEVNKLIRER